MNIELEKWRKSIRKPIGLEAQLKMSPQLRASDIEKYINKDKATKSAVLILIYEKKGDLFIILTKRSSKLSKHSGQISFPGGTKDDADLDLVSTALREAEEEIGLNIKVEVLGELTPLLIPITNFCVHQFVAFTSLLPNLSFNEHEVEKLMEVSISDLRNKDNIKYGKFGKTSSGRLVEAPYYDLNGEKIWGATAMMISELLETLF